MTDTTGAHRDILCVQEKRAVGNDTTVRYRRLCLQIPPSPLRPHFVKARVRVHDGAVKISQMVSGALQAGTSDMRIGEEISGVAPVRRPDRRDPHLDHKTLRRTPA